MNRDAIINAITAGTNATAGAVRAHPILAGVLAAFLAGFIAGAILF